LARTNYQFEKRKKELAKKRKQEEKRKRKLEKKRDEQLTDKETGDADPTEQEPAVKESSDNTTDAT
jgi:hypothetical protein